MLPNSSAGTQGQQTPADSASEFNAHHFLIKTILSGIATATLVQVKKVTNDGGLSPTGFVDLLPLINQIDGDGNSMPHPTIFNCPYGRLQGGANAVIIDPQVGDIGFAIFASRDTSSVVANKAQANPGSRRRFDWADALYIGVSTLTEVPTQYVRFSAAGIEIVSPTEVKLSAPTVEIDCTTLTVNASTAVNITTPSFNVEGNSTLTGSIVVTEGAVFDGEMAVAGLANFNGGANVDEVPIGPAHRHDLTGGGQTLGVHV